MKVSEVMTRNVECIRPGDSLMQADRSHLHHTLMDMGLGRRETLALLVAYAIACAIVGLALESVPEFVSLLTYVLLFCGHCIFVLKTEMHDVEAIDHKVV